MQDELRRYGSKLQREGRAPVEIRVGVNSGEVVVRSIRTGGTHAEYTPIGHTTNLAARLQAIARTGSIVVSENTRKLTEGYFQLRALGAMRVKGIAEAVNVYEVTGLGALRTRLQRAVGRGLTRFVGRGRELNALKEALELTKAGHGQIVATVGEPGVGKSRLVYEFKAISQSGCMVLEAFSVSYGKASTYLPVIDLLRSYFDISPGDDERKRREKVTGRVVALDRSLEDTLPYLFSLLAIVEGDDPTAQMDGQFKKRRTYEAIKRIVLRESLNQPLIVIFEDLHWVDRESEALLSLLADSIGTAKVLLLVNYRPEYSHGWGSKTYYTQLRLDPLGRENAEEMLDSLLSMPLARSVAGEGKRGDEPRAGEGADLRALSRLIIEKTEGTPFFMEETVQGLLDDGFLVRNGTMKLARPLAELKIPPTVQAILASRIDRLPPDEKELLQTLAVIGREFPLSLVREVTKHSEFNLNRMLNGLQLGEFIYERPAVGDVEYEFKHALTQEVAYNSVLSERRKILHERTGQVIEALFDERLDDHCADLAHHYRSSNNALKAIHYLCLAGEQSARRGAYAQALANAESALTMIQRLPEGHERLRAELRVRLVQGMCAPALYGAGSEDRRQIFQRVCDLSEQLGDKSALIRGLLNVAGAYLGRGQVSRALKASRRCVELTEEGNDPEMLSAALLQFAESVRLSGDLVHASSLLDELMKRDRSAYQQAAVELLPVNIWVETPTFLALTRHLLGSPDQALAFSEEALKRARQLEHPFALAWIGMTDVALHYWRREPEVARVRAEQFIGLAEEHGFTEIIAVGRVLRGCAMAELGDADKGIAEVEANATLVPGMITVSGMLAQVYIAVDRAGQALKILNQSLTEGEQTGLHHDDAELHRLKGEAILARDSSATGEAENCFRKAIEIAQRQSAKWWELRSAVSLACLLRDTNRRDEARAMLAEIYNWFTEGFDLPDLREARALLDEWAR